MFDPQSPIFQAAIAPFVASLFLVGLLLLLVPGQKKSAFAVCGAGIAILGAYWLAFSWPPFPPRSASQKLGYLIVISTVASFLAANRTWLGRAAPAIPYLIAIPGIIWIAQSKLQQGEFMSVALVAGLAAIAIFALGRCRHEPVDAGVTVLVFSLVMAGIAFLAPSVSIAQLAGAVAAATGGYLILNWPKRRMDFSEAGIIAIALPLIWLATQASLYSRANDAAIGIATAIAFAPAARAAVIRMQPLTNDVLRPICTGVAAVAIGAGALAMAYANQAGASGYG